MTPAGIEPATFRFVAQHLNHWATAVPISQYTSLEFGEENVHLMLDWVLVRMVIRMGGTGLTRKGGFDINRAETSDYTSRESGTFY